MFWLTGQDTYGAEYDDDEKRTEWAIKSREKVLSHDKFKQIFEPYAAAIGIDKEQEVPEWQPIKEKWAKKAAEKEAKRLEAEQKKKEAAGVAADAKKKMEMTKEAAQEATKKADETKKKAEEQKKELKEEKRAEDQKVAEAEKKIQQEAAAAKKA